MRRSGCALGTSRCPLSPALSPAPLRSAGAREIHGDHRLWAGNSLLDRDLDHDHDRDLDLDLDHDHDHERDRDREAPPER
jgi:hypothetical protein